METEKRVGVCLLGPMLRIAKVATSGLMSRPVRCEDETGRLRGQVLADRPVVLLMLDLPVDRS